MAQEQEGKLASFLVTVLEATAPQAFGPALTKAAVDDSKAGAEGTHKGRGQFHVVLGFQDTSWVWRLRELLIKGPWVGCYSQGQQGFLHGRREDGHSVKG